MSRSLLPLGHSPLSKLTCWKGLWKALPIVEEVTRLLRGRHNSLVTTLVRSGLTIPKSPDTCVRKSWYLRLVARPGSDLCGVVINWKCMCVLALQPSGTVAASGVLLRIGAAFARRKRPKRGASNQKDNNSRLPPSVVLLPPRSSGSPDFLSCGSAHCIGLLLEAALSILLCMPICLTGHRPPTMCCCWAAGSA
jgi:hypothetical protein